MNRFRTTLTFIALTLLAGACLAHETRILGPEDGTQYAVTVGMLDVRPQFRSPGRYTDDYVLTIPGTYLIRITGFIGELEIDETYPREVADVTHIRFP